MCIINVLISLVCLVDVINSLVLRYFCPAVTVLAIKHFRRFQSQDTKGAKTKMEKGCRFKKKKKKTTKKHLHSISHCENTVTFILWNIQTCLAFCVAVQNSEAFLCFAEITFSIVHWFRAALLLSDSFNASFPLTIQDLCHSQIVNAYILKKGEAVIIKWSVWSEVKQWSNNKVTKEFHRGIKPKVFNISFLRHVSPPLLLHPCEVLSVFYNTPSINNCCSRKDNIVTWDTFYVYQSFYRLWQNINIWHPHNNHEWMSCAKNLWWNSIPLEHLLLVEMHLYNDSKDFWVLLYL